MRRNDGRLSIFAQRLRQLRTLSGMTQRELAEHLQLERSTYAYYETGVTTPSFETLQRLAKEFQVPIDYLLGGEFSPSQTEVRQSGSSLLPMLEGAAYMGNCNEEERSFLSLFRRMDADTKQKVLVYCAELLEEKETEE